MLCSCNRNDINVVSDNSVSVSEQQESNSKEDLAAENNYHQEHLHPESLENSDDYIEDSLSEYDLFIRDLHITKRILSQQTGYSYLDIDFIALDPEMDNHDLPTGKEEYFGTTLEAQQKAPGNIYIKLLFSGDYDIFELNHKTYLSQSDYIGTFIIELSQEHLESIQSQSAEALICCVKVNEVYNILTLPEPFSPARINSMPSSQTIFIGECYSYIAKT